MNHEIIMFKVGHKKKIVRYVENIEDDKLTTQYDNHQSMKYYSTDWVVNVVIRHMNRYYKNHDIDAYVFQKFNKEDRLVAISKRDDSIQIIKLFDKNLNTQKIFAKRGINEISNYINARTSGVTGHLYISNDDVEKKIKLRNELKDIEDQISKFTIDTFNEAVNNGLLIHNMLDKYEKNKIGLK